MHVKTMAYALLFVVCYRVRYGTQRGHRKRCVEHSKPKHCV